MKMLKLWMVPHKNKNRELAGIQLLLFTRRIDSTIPFILQTTEKEYNLIAQKHSVEILNKNSQKLPKTIKKRTSGVFAHRKLACTQKH